MPRSAEEGKREFFLPEITRMHGEQSINTVLDVGPGVGTYATLLRSILPQAEYTCIEVYEPYVHRYNLKGLYQKVIVENVVDVDLPEADLVILGDVLEHVTYDDALILWSRARRAARRAVLLSLPIIHYEQGEVDGNIYEAHLYHWTHQEVLTTLDGIDKWWTGQIVGCYIADPQGA